MNKIKKERIGEKRKTNDGLWEMKCVEYEDAKNIKVEIKFEIHNIKFSFKRKTNWCDFDKGRLKFNKIIVDGIEYRKCNTCLNIIKLENFNKGSAKCIECEKKHKHEYYNKHKEEIIKNIDKEKKKKHDRKYRQKNKDKIKKRKRKWEVNNPEKVFNNHNKRRNKLENQGRGITKEQYIECNNWFDWKCAYSGEILKDTNDTHGRTLDHIVAIDNGGLNEPWNVVPMRKGYNSSKFNRINSLDWYMEQEYFDIEKLNKIVEWQKYAFDKWATENDELILITDLLED